MGDADSSSGVATEAVFIVLREHVVDLEEGNIAERSHDGSEDDSA